MSADPLRRAASLMRERAKAATPGPWRIENRIVLTDASEARVLLGEFLNADLPECRANAAHAASMHPAVTLEIAAFLHFAAAYGDQPSPQSPTVQFAAAIARAYLGESA